MRFALSSHPLSCPEFGWLLCSERFRQRHAPDRLLYLGATPTCSEFERWALDSGASGYVFCEHEGPDPLGMASVIAHGDPAQSLTVLLGELESINHQPHARQLAFAGAILAGDRLCQRLVGEELRCEAGLAEGAAVACMAHALPDGAQWALGNSLPIREADAYVLDCADVAILSQRGANGIDGLISGAAGSALATQLPTLLMLGDVSMLHDLGGLAVARLVQTPLVLAVIDNDGGRIFDLLPIHELYAAEPGLAQFWRTSPCCDLEHAAHLFGLRYSAPATEAELSAAIHAALRENSATLMHVRVGPDSARTMRARILARLFPTDVESGA